MTDSVRVTRLGASDIVRIRRADSDGIVRLVFDQRSPWERGRYCLETPSPAEAMEMPDEWRAMIVMFEPDGCHTWIPVASVYHEDGWMIFECGGRDGKSWYHLAVVRHMKGFVEVGS